MDDTTIPSPQNSPYDDDEEGFQQRSAPQFITLSTQDILQKYLDFASVDHILLMDSLLESVHTKMLSSISERKPSKSLQVTYPDILKRLHCTFCYLRRISHFLPQTYLMTHLHKFTSIYLTLLRPYSETSLHYVSEDSDLTNFLHDLTNKIHNRTIQLTKSPKPEKLPKESLCIEWVLCDLIESSFHLEPALSFGNAIIETLIDLYTTLQPTITSEKSPSEAYIANKLCTSALHAVKQIIKGQESLNGLTMPPLGAYLKFWIDNLGNQEPRQDQESENINEGKGNVKKQYEELIMDLFANVIVENHSWFSELSKVLLGILQDLVQGKGPVDIEKDMEDQDRIKMIEILERLLGILVSPEQLTQTIKLLKDFLIVQGEEGVWAIIREKCFGRIENIIALQQVLIEELKNLDSSSSKDNSEEYISLLDEVLELFKNIPDDEGINTILEDFIQYLTNIPAPRFEGKVQSKVLQVFDEVLSRENLLDKALESANVVGLVLRKVAHGAYLPLFIHFIEAVYQKMTVNPATAMPFFSKVKHFLEFLEKTAPLEEDIAKYRTVFLTISHLMVKLLHSSDHPDLLGHLSCDLNHVYDPNTFVFQPFLFTKKSTSYQESFTNSAIYEKILHCLELKEFQTTEIGLCLLTLTFCLLQDSKETLKNFTQNRYHLLFFNVLTGFNKTNLFSEKQAIMSINLLFNLLTNNEFFYLCQSRLQTQDPLVTPEMLDNLTRDPEAKAIQYITIKNEDFLYVLLKILFEWTGISQDTKLYYLEILDQILKNSLYNALSCLQGPIVNYLLICLRKERSEVIKRPLADILRHMLVTNMGPLQLKSLIKGVRYDYQKLYPNSFKEYVSENVTKEFLEGMLDPESYYQTLQILFKDTIPKILDNQKGNPESFIHFSGESSGILIEDLVLKDLPKYSFLGSILSPLKGFSIYVEFRSENLNTMNKKNLGFTSDYKDVHQGSTVSTDMSSSMLSNYKIDEDYFPSEIVRRPTNHSIISSTQQQREIKEMYHPRLFSLYSTKGPGNLDLYIDYHEGKRVIALEGWTTKKKMYLKQTFKAEIEEGKWYIMVLNYSKSTVSLYLNGEEAKRDQEVDFSPVMSSLDTFNTLAVGVACDLNLNIQPPFDPKTSFQGQIRNFLLFPFEIPQGNLTSNLHTSRVSHRRQTMAKELRDSQPKKKVNKIDPEELFGASLFNLNVFVMISKLDVHKEIPWVPSFNINKKEKEDLSENNDSRIRVSSQGVFYFETSKFEETLFAIGGLDAFIYCFELFANFTSFRDSKQSVEIFNEALKILQELTQHNYKEDSLAYLQNNGIYELIYLIQQFVIKQGGSLELVSGIMSFFESLPDNLMKYKGLHALFWKLNIWESCPYDLQNQIFKKSMNLIQLDDSKKAYFRQNLASLLFHMKKLHNSKTTSLTDQDLLSTSLSDPFQSPDSKFRKTVLIEIITNMCQGTDEDTARKELRTFIEYIASCGLDIHLYEALVTLIKLFNSAANKHSTGFLPLPRLQLIFDQVNLQSVLIYILIRCYSPEFQSRNPPPSERIVDLIAASTLNLIDYMIFSRVEEEVEIPESMTQSFFGLRRSKQPSIHENRMNRIKSFSLIEPPSRQNSIPNYPIPAAVRLDSSSPADEMEGVFLKLLNFTCGEGVDKESYQSLMRLIKASEANDEDLLIKNKNLLAVALNKAMTWNSEIQQLFLGEFSKLLKIPKNLNIFFEAPNYHEFIHFCLDMVDAENNTKKEIARTCVIHLMKSQEGMLKLIKACKSGEHKEACFIRLIKDHVLEIFEKSMGILENPLIIEGELMPIKLMSKEFVSNIIHLLTFINTWKLEDLMLYEEEIVKLSEVLFRLFNNLEIMWSILPDFRIQAKKNEALSIIKKIETASLYKNGGVFFTFLHLLLNLFVHSRLPESKTLCIKALETLINPPNPSNPGSQNNLSLDKSIEDPMISKAMSQSQKIKIVVYETILLKRIDQANENLTGIMKHPNSLGYLEPIAARKPSDLPPLENLVYGYILFILLQKVLEIEEENEDSHEKKEMMRLIKYVIRQGGSGLRVLSEGFVGKEKQELLIKMERNKKKDKETEQMFVKELDDMLEEIKGAEMEKKIAAKQKEPQEDQRRLFNEFLVEKDDLEKFVKKNRGFVEKWLVPNLETRCAIVINTVQEMSRWYYETNKGSQGTMRFEEVLMEGKGLGIFMEMLEKAREMKERFDKEYNDWDMKERRNHLKIKKKWNFQRSKLTQDRGIWQTEEREQERIYYKIDKAEDFLRRRMRLKRDYQAQNKEYLSVAAYQEKYKARIEQEMELKSQQVAAQRALRESSKGEGRVSLRKSSSVKNNNKEKEDEKEEVELEFNEIPKEEILLVDTRETVVDFQESMILKKKLIEKWKQPVEKIALKGAVYGDLEISQSKYISFSPSQIERSDDPPYCFGALKNSFIKNYKKKKQWKISNIKEVHARNYNLRPTAVEIFIKDDAKTYFFNLYTKELQQEFISLLKALNPKIFAIADRAKQFQELKIHNKWVEGELSNFEYLMILNTFAGRSFNDINQYPVFPWVLKDFTSETLDLETEDEEERKKIFRELDTPIGAIDPRKRADAREKFENWDDPSEPKFHYGSHYSNAGSVINFLIRLEPFTSLNIDLQSGKFDQADRLFASIRLAWHSCTHNRGDFRELTPEFYYMPEFLQNYNKMNFGKTQKNTDISEVELPPWANNKPEEFIMKHREALECDYVSQNLHKWIDLIFGSRQRGKKAAESYNVFRGISYEGGVDISQIEDKDMQSILLQQIFHLGQTPTQLFTEDHPAKNLLKIRSNKERLSYYIFNKKALKKETNQGLNINLIFKENQHPVIHISKDPEYIHIIYRNMDLYSIPYNPKSGLYNHFLIWEEVKKSSIITNLGSASLNEFYPSNQISTLLQPGRPTYHIVGGYPDNSFKIFKDGLIFDSILLHKKVVTAIHSACVPRIRQTIIAAGSKDCRISLWNFSSDRSFPPEQKRTPYQILYGHHNEITALYIENILGILVSCDKDNVVMVFCVSTGKLQRSIYPEMDPDDYIKMVRVDENGFIILLTTKSVILTYSINGKFLMKADEFSAKTGHEISSLSLIDRHKPYIVIAVNIRERKGLIAIDYLTMREKKSLNTNMKYADRSHKKLIKEIVKKQLKETTPTMMIMGDGEKFMYLGYGNGALAVLGGNYENCFEENKVALTDFGFEI